MTVFALMDTLWTKITNAFHVDKSIGIVFLVLTLTLAHFVNQTITCFLPQKMS